MHARTGRLAAAAVLGVLALLAVAQLVLPPIARDEVRDRLGGAGEVTAVEVRALPAIQLLWHHADRVSARVRSYDASRLDLAGELAQTAGVGALDVRIARVDAGRGVVLRDLRVTKRDGLVHGSAILDGGQLAAALPEGAAARLLPRADGSVVLAGAIGDAPLQAGVEARDGRVVVRPDGLLGLVTSLTLFADPRVSVERIAARPLPGGRFQLSATARVR